MNSDKDILIDQLRGVFPKDLIGDIYKYAISAHFQKWIPIEKIVWESVVHCECKEAVYQLREKMNEPSFDHNIIDLRLIACSGCDEAVDFTVEYILSSKTPNKTIIWEDLVLFSNCNAMFKLVNKCLTYPDSDINKKIYGDIDWGYLSNGMNNIECVNLFRAHPDKINWFNVSCGYHKEAVQLLRENPTKINWKNLSKARCKEAVQLLRENPTKIDYDIMKNSITYCDESIELLLTKFTINELNWNAITYCDCKSDVDLIKTVLDDPTFDIKIDWGDVVISDRDDVIDLIRLALDNPSFDKEKIDWDMISYSNNKKAITLIREKLDDPSFDKDKIKWNRISAGCNVYAVDLIKEKFFDPSFDKEKIDWGELCASPYIYEYRLF